jgi:ubiquinone/menaquinone biosynthesis C-methylase UbiE
MSLPAGAVSEKIILICPACRSCLPWPEFTDSSLACDCGRQYPAMLGIPDLRIGEDPYCGNDHDLAIARDLLARFESHSFTDLLHHYFTHHCPELDPQAIDRQMRHILESTTEVSHFELNQNTVAADLGSGAGGSILSFIKNNVSPERIVGIDIALRWLVLARKRLDENGLKQVPLVCANAEAIPLATGRFDVIFGGDMIEHVADPHSVFSEVGRLLAEGGHAAFPTPNRFSIGREPHVGLFFAGWLPRLLAPAYCRLRGAPPWQGIFTRSAWSWRSLLIRLFFNDPGIIYSISPGRVGSPGGKPVRLVHAYNAALSGSLFFQLLARCFGPILVISLKRTGKSA